MKLYLSSKNHVPGGIATVKNQIQVRISQKFYDDFLVINKKKSDVRHTWAAIPLDFFSLPFVRRLKPPEACYLVSLALDITRTTLVQPPYNLHTTSIPPLDMVGTRYVQAMYKLVQKLQSNQYLEILHTYKQTEQTNKQTRKEEQRTMSSSSELAPSASPLRGASALTQEIDKDTKKEERDESSFIAIPLGAPTEMVGIDIFEEQGLINRQEVIDARLRKAAEREQRGKV